MWRFYKLAYQSFWRLGKINKYETQRDIIQISLLTLPPYGLMPSQPYSLSLTDLYSGFEYEAVDVCGAGFFEAGGVVEVKFNRGTTKLHFNLDF